MLVFIDMDGVVSDFDEHIVNCYGKPMDQMSGSEKDQFWKIDCAAKQFFANSPPISEGVAMVKRFRELGIPLCFLTSTGGGEQHTEIARQKLHFLREHGMGRLPVAFATGTASKAAFANKNTVLIDDRQKVVTAFAESGGKAFLFNRWNSNAIAIQIEEIMR